MGPVPPHVAAAARPLEGTVAPAGQTRPGACKTSPMVFYVGRFLPREQTRSEQSGLKAEETQCVAFLIRRLLSQAAPIDRWLGSGHSNAGLPPACRWRRPLFGGNAICEAQQGEGKKAGRPALEPSPASPEPSMTSSPPGWAPRKEPSQTMQQQAEFCPRRQSRQRRLVATWELILMHHQAPSQEQCWGVGRQVAPSGYCPFFRGTCPLALGGAGPRGCCDAKFQSAGLRSCCVFLWVQ